VADVERLAVAEVTFELIAAGIGVALLSAGNARIYQRPGVRCVAVPDLPPSELAVARRRDDRRRPVFDLVAAAVAASAAPR
jgi:DNA-binding transcriptional LysR family regulator